MVMQHLLAEITHNHAEEADYRIIELHAPGLAGEVQPGQFVHLRVTQAADPLLRRPISVMLVDKRAACLRLLVQKVGRGTELLAAMPAGAQVDLLGPLGNGFPLPPPGKDALLVAGGVGIAPLIFLADVLRTLPEAPPVRGLYGGRSDAQLPVWTELAARCEEFYVATEDGSAGETGRVTDLLPEQLARGDVQVVYTCGPRLMMAEVVRQTMDAGLKTYVSLEQWMGCGVGACLGCVVPATGGREYVRVCKDGPVFEASEIDWERMPA